MRKGPIYVAILENNKAFAGGMSYQDSKWLDITLKIKRIFYKLPDDNTLCLSNFDKYYHLVECVKDFNGPKQGQEIVEYVRLYGMKDNKVTEYVICLTDKKETKIGDIQRREYEATDEYVLRLNTTGWK